MKHHYEAEKSDPDHRLLISCIAIADVYANIFNIGSVGNHFIAEEHVMAIFEQNNLSWNSLSQLQ